MTTLLEVLNSHREKIDVSIPKDTNCESFWGLLAQEMYHNHTLENLGLDYAIRHYMTEFARDDSLDLLTKKGKILKRFARFYKEQAGKDLTNEVLGIIGDRLQYYVNLKTQCDYIVDFTDTINWEDGYFGKSGSCWFGAYKDSVPTFENGGGWAIRFYSSHEDKRGIGRTWIVPHNGVLLCFNSYGVERPNTSRVIKAIFNLHGITLHYQQTNIENEQNSDIPYINSGTGFVLYPEGVTPQDSYDLDMDVIRSHRCYHCGNAIENDDYSNIDDHDYCDSCVSRLFSFCDRCGEYYREGVHPVPSSSRYTDICESCADYLGYSLCESCNEYEHCIRTEDSEEYYCESCRKDMFCCDVCGDWYANQDYCDSCQEDESEEEETPQSDYEFERDFISMNMESVTLASNNVLVTEVYRHEHINGLIVILRERQYGVVHEPSGLYIRSYIPELFKSIVFMEHLATLADWTQDKDTLINNTTLMQSVNQAIREFIA